MLARNWLLVRFARSALPRASSSTSFSCSRSRVRNPDLATISWKAPAWTGYGKIQDYEIGYRALGEPKATWEPVGGNTHAELKLDSKRTWSIHVRAIGDTGKAPLSKELMIAKQGAPGTQEVDPAVSLAEAGGALTVDFKGVVGSSTKYPKMDVAVAPTLGGAGFHDRHAVTNQAGRVTFDSVPCGVHTVVVTGQGPDASKEFGRMIVNRCDTGTVPANQWKLVYGRADIKATRWTWPTGTRPAS
jgi:Fibronectin type III domain